MSEDVCIPAHYGKREKPLEHGNRLRWVELNGASSNINCGSDTSLDDLPAAGNLTVDAWVKADSWGGGNRGTIVYKGELVFEIGAAFGLRGQCIYTIAGAISDSGVDDFTPDGEWHHVVMAWSVGTAEIHLAIDGIWVPAYQAHTPGAGAYQTDAAVPLYISAKAAIQEWEGGIAWVRISNNLRWTPGTNFTPPVMCAPPPLDANTVELWALDEGHGTTAAASVNSPDNDGTMTDCTWRHCP